MFDTSLVGRSDASLTAYRAGRRQPPSIVAGRIRLLALVVVLLDGSYNDAGIRRWWERGNRHLEGEAPQSLLAGEDWAASDAGPQRVVRAALALLA